jgi:hypothetical protein
LAECTWYRDIIYFLQELRPPNGMGKIKARDLNLKEIRYCLIDQVLYWKDPLGVLLKCLDPHEAQNIMFDFHDSLCGGHHLWRTTTSKLSGMGTTGLLYSLTSVQKSGLASNVRNYLGSINSSLYH